MQLCRAFYYVNSHPVCTLESKHCRSGYTFTKKRNIYLVSAWFNLQLSILHKELSYTFCIKSLCSLNGFLRRNLLIFSAVKWFIFLIIVEYCINFDSIVSTRTFAVCQRVVANTHHFVTSHVLVKFLDCTNLFYWFHIFLHHKKVFGIILPVESCWTPNLLKWWGS